MVSEGPKGLKWNVIWSFDFFINDKKPVTKTDLGKPNFKSTTTTTILQIVWHVLIDLSSVLIYNVQPAQI